LLFVKKTGSNLFFYGLLPVNKNLMKEGTGSTIQSLELKKVTNQNQNELKQVLLVWR
jgi:hypothetical protein